MGKQIKLSELIFIVEEAPEEGYIAEADSMESIKEIITDAVKCHFE